MMTIKLVCVGNLKEKFWIEACEEYKKRLSKFCKLSIIEVEEQNRLDNIPLILKREGEAILECSGNGPILLAIEGKQLSSEEFALFMEKQKMEKSEINFIIGGSYGVSEEVKKAASHKISFGKPTFPHNLARVMLLEQIYRAFMISSGAKYHK